MFNSTTEKAIGSVTYVDIWDNMCRRVSGFMNRCDTLDPALAWTGVKESGRGCALSTLAYQHLTRPKSFHLRTAL